MDSSFNPMMDRGKYELFFIKKAGIENTTLKNTVGRSRYDDDGYAVKGYRIKGDSIFA